MPCLKNRRKNRGEEGGGFKKRFSPFFFVLKALYIMELDPFLYNAVDFQNMDF
jgi:hypothetical protein